MHRLLSSVGLAVEVGLFALVCLAASPVLVFKFGADCVRARIERRWPDSHRARVASFWIGLLAPVVFMIMALGVVWLVTAPLRARPSG